MTEHGRHEAPEPVGEPLAALIPDDPAPPPGDASPSGLRADLADAVTVRTVAMVVAVLLLQLGFILSYVGAFHAPKPRHITVGVVAPAQVSSSVLGGLDAVAGQPLSARAVPDEASARARIENGSLSAALVVAPSGTTDRLLVASGGGTSVVTAVEQVIDAAEAARHRTVDVVDVVPLQAGDGRGLSGFYLVVGWIVGGYLVAALLAVSRGARPATPRRAAIRLVAMVPYAVASGLGGVLVVDQGLGALTGHFLALSALGALLVYAAATVTMAFQVLLGVIGIGLTVLVFVVLGNPSAGGAYQPALLPPFWRALSGALPNGAGTDSVRRIVYFGSSGIGGHLAVIAAYAVAGLVVTLAACVVRSRRAS